MDIVKLLRTRPLYEGYGEESSIPDDAANEIVKLREVLAFYAEWGIDAPAVDAIIEEDRGDKARAALNIVLANLENGDYL
jgi:hypothetical protein